MNKVRFVPMRSVRPALLVVAIFALFLPSCGSKKKVDTKDKDSDASEQKDEPKKKAAMSVSLTEVSYDSRRHFLTVIAEVKTEGVELITPECDLEPAGGGAKIKAEPFHSYTGTHLGKATLLFKADLKPGKYSGTLRLRSSNHEAMLKIDVDASDLAPSQSGPPGRLECLTQTCTVELLESGMLEVKAADGTKIEMTGSTATIAGGKATVPVDLLNGAAKQDPTRLDAISVPLTLTFSDSTKVVGSYPFTKYQVETGISQKLLTVTKGGISLPGDDEMPAKARLVATMTQIGHGLEFYGSGTTMQSIDLIAINNVSSQTGSCGSYRNSRTGAIVRVDKITDNSEVTIYERRTGRVKKRIQLRATPATCPDVIEGGSSAVSSVPQSDIKAFILKNM